MKKMTESEEQIETIVDGIRSILRNAKMWNVDFQRGINRWAAIGEGSYKLSPTGGYTITIDIDGGRHDTEMPPGDLHNAFPEYGS